MGIKDMFLQIGTDFVSHLPGSPFRSSIDALGNIPGLGVVNWFFPIGDFITITSAWLVAIALFYLYSIIMRWVKMIGD